MSNSNFVIGRVYTLDTDAYRKWYRSTQGSFVFLMGSTRHIKCEGLNQVGGGLCIECHSVEEPSIGCFGIPARFLSE